MLQAQTSDLGRLHINTRKQIAIAKKEFNGTNIEDLNNQTNGGIFSQLIHGEAFEENIDIDFLNLPLSDYVKVHVILDERKIPHFFSVANTYTRPVWNNLTEKYDFNSKDIYSMVNLEPQRQTQGQTSRPMKPMRIGSLTFYGRFSPYDSLDDK